MVDLIQSNQNDPSETPDPLMLSEMNSDLDYLLDMDQDTFDKFEQRNQIFKQMEKIDVSCRPPHQCGKMARFVPPEF